MKYGTVLSLVFLLLVAAVWAQSPAPVSNPLSAATKSMYEMARNNILKSAEKMAEGDYSFRPVETVMTFRQLLIHVAEANVMVAGNATAEEKPKVTADKEKATKAEVIAALKASFAFTDKLYDGLTDARALELVDMWKTKRPVAYVLSFNVVHNYEHYGNLVTYMRIKGLVPPSSEKR
jgi:uncharacterized damage-inducible protein DinB